MTKLLSTLELLSYSVMLKVRVDMLSYIGSFNKFWIIHVITLTQIFSSMTVNLLTLNSCKTEFLLTGLSKKLTKIHNSSLNTTHSARNFGFTFDEHHTVVECIVATALDIKSYAILILASNIKQDYHSLVCD